MCPKSPEIREAGLIHGRKRIRTLLALRRLSKDNFGEAREHVEEGKGGQDVAGLED